MSLNYPNKWLLLFAIFLTFNACQSNEKKRTQKVFENYLNTEFQINISGHDDFLFFIVPTYSCGACELKFRQLYLNYCPQKIKSYVICSDISKERVPPNQCAMLLVDNSRKIDRLDIGARATTMIYFQKGKLLNLLEFTDNNMDDINSLINRLSE